MSVSWDDLIVRSGSGQEPVITMTSPEALAAMADRRTPHGVRRPAPLPGPANGVRIDHCDHPDCNGEE